MAPLLNTSNQVITFKFNRPNRNGIDAIYSLVDGIYIDRLDLVCNDLHFTQLGAVYWFGNVCDWWRQLRWKWLKCANMLQIRLADFFPCEYKVSTNNSDIFEPLYSQSFDTWHVEMSQVCKNRCYTTNSYELCTFIRLFEKARFWATNVLPLFFGWALNHRCCTATINRCRKTRKVLFASGRNGVIYLFISLRHLRNCNGATCAREHYYCFTSNLTIFTAIFLCMKLIFLWNEINHNFKLIPKPICLLWHSVYDRKKAKLNAMV